MRPASPDLVRRWVAALLLAPESERGAIVESVEARMAEMYLDDEPAEDELPASIEVKATTKSRARHAG